MALEEAAKLAEAEKTMALETANNGLIMQLVGLGIVPASSGTLEEQIAANTALLASALGRDRSRTALTAYYTAAETVNSAKAALAADPYSIDKAKAYQTRRMQHRMRPTQPRRRPIQPELQRNRRRQIPRWMWQVRLSQCLSRRSLKPNVLQT